MQRFITASLNNFKERKGLVMRKKTMKEHFQAAIVKKALAYMDNDLENSLPKLLEWADQFLRIICF